MSDTGVIDQNPMPYLISLARRKVSKTSGHPFVALSEICPCEVEIAYFSPPRERTEEDTSSTPGSSRERYSPCAAHILKK